MRILYPVNPLDPTQADAPYQEEFKAVQAEEYACSLFDFDALAFGEFKPRPAIQTGEAIVYRGWMLNVQGYKNLVAHIERKGGIPITSIDHYLQCHHLPGWYAKCASFTAETHFVEGKEELAALLDTLQWDCYFIKDFVKSNTGDAGSIAHSLEEAYAIVEQIATYRGEVEGGLAVRRVEAYRPETERRYFVVYGVPFGMDGGKNDVPETVRAIAPCIDAPFYSVDVIQTTTGEMRLVELGDGQVSDTKAWSTSRFVKTVIARLAESHL